MLQVDSTHRKCGHRLINVTERALTDFEQVLLGMVVSQPRSGYELKKLFTVTPAEAYRPSSGALYPALRRLEQRGLLRVEAATSAGRRNRRVWHPTKDGLTEHLSWIRQPVQPDRIAHDLPLHLMRFVLMETVAPREDVLAFLAGLIDGLEQFVKGMEAYAATAGRQLPGRHPLLALRHGIVMHQASLDWARATAAELASELIESPEYAGHPRVPPQRRRIRPDNGGVRRRRGARRAARLGRLGPPDRPLRRRSGPGNRSRRLGHGRSARAVAGDGGIAVTGCLSIWFIAAAAETTA
jgi:DNA-binding PadR family transcriptional regulator